MTKMVICVEKDEQQGAQRAKRGIEASSSIANYCSQLQTVVPMMSRVFLSCS